MRQNEFVDKIIQATLGFAPNAKALKAALSFIQEITLQDQATVRLKVLEKFPSEEKERPISVEEVKNSFDKILDDYLPTGNAKTFCKPVSPELITPAMVESKKQFNELETAVAEKIAAQEKAEEKRDEKDALIVQGILALMEDKEVRWSGRFTKKDMERLEIPAKVRAAIGSYVKGPPIKFLKKSFVTLKRVGKRAVWEFEFSV